MIHTGIFDYKTICITQKTQAQFQKVIFQSLVLKNSDKQKQIRLNELKIQPFE